jgi:adenosine deaminase
MRNNYPLIDLHRHLEGCVRPETIIELGLQHNLPLPAQTVPDLLPHIQVTSPVADVMTFIAKFDLMQWCMVNHEAIRRITFECIEDASHEGIDYLELRFSPLFMAEKHKLDLELVVDAVCDGLNEALEALSIRAKLIGILSRTYGTEACWQELRAILRGRDRGIVGVDLAGDEINYPGKQFVEHIRHARDAGMRITIHAGESTSAEEVKQAIIELEAERLGHAVSAIDDPAVLELIRQRAVGIENCPTSNVQTGVVPGYAKHPLPAYLRQDLLVTLNTDNPTISGIDLPSEYKTLATESDLTGAELDRLQRNSVQVAFLSDDERSELLSGISGEAE